MNGVSSLLAFSDQFPAPAIPFQFRSGAILSSRRFRGTVRGRLRGLRRSLGRECRDRGDVGLFEAFVSQPEDIEASFVAVDEFVAVILALENIAGQI
jgi:hypothetical protein